MLTEGIRLLGVCAGPDDVYLALRGVRTLSVRLAQHYKSGLEIARWLAGRPGVEMRRIDVQQDGKSAPLVIVRVDPATVHLRVAYAPDAPRSLSAFVRAVLPMYVRVPTGDEQKKAEFKLQEHLDWYKENEASVTKPVLGAWDVLSERIDARVNSRDGLIAYRLRMAGKAKEADELLVVLDPDTTLHLGQQIPVWRMSAVNYPERVKEMHVTPLELHDFMCDTCQFTPVSSFRYRVTVLDSNGCKATDDRLVVVDKTREVFVPNVFEPDHTSDSGNDFFTVFGGEDVQVVKSLRIFNRWGKEVFERLDFAPNDPLQGWDGRIKGDQAAPAVFLYIAEVLFKDGETVQYKGDVTLIR